MVAGTQSLLSNQQVDLLQQALKFNDFTSLQTVKFSLFASGRITALPLVEKSQEATSQKRTDSLTLAQDFIEYSQLEQAMAELEQGLFQSDREDIQQLLLDLYRSTKSKSRFSKTYQQAQAKGISLIPDWSVLQRFFSDQSS